MTTQPTLEDKTSNINSIDIHLDLIGYHQANLIK